MGSFLEILCAVLIPPVGVFLRFGCGVIFGVLALFAPDVLWFYPWNGICYMGSY
ncbi:hypothetical protein IGI04_002435 [Brassica rapa subsp. trilocularis]|uniref:Uncharacterized protein n=2 Tax=Brassica TaxID=3705 RepID=A0ABQ7B6X4_BRACR|nr:hypothetical protein DY000_02040961 [Brassica cretica]KAG5414868.1 hypothetical protein IGI04_002435 [Brassica rapa subsp. trilocularis]